MATESKEERAPPPAGAGKTKRRLATAGVVALALAVAGVVVRSLEGAKLAETTRQRAIPTVATVTPEQGAGEQEVVLPGNVEALYDARMRARVSGYVRDWVYDIGAHVKAGDVLVTIEAPELDQQLQQAKGDLVRAQAEVDLAKLTSKRWSALRASTAVSQQSADEKSGDYAAKVAAAEAARANVDRLKALQGFLQITAPFAGVVTARNVDIGALVSPDMAHELFSVADVHQVRIYVPTPQAFAAEIKNGLVAQLKLPQYPGRAFAAKVLTTSNAITEKSRTLLVQLLADNPDGALLPGSYAEVHFKLPGRPGLLRIPAAVILYRDNKLNVATVGADDKALIKPIEIARDLGQVIEVAVGVTPDDRLILNPPQTLSDGDDVRLASKKTPASVKPGLQ